MNFRGQIFSIDLIVAMIILVLFLGILITHSETITYSEKENIQMQKLIQKSEAGLTALLNGKYSCTTSSQNRLANSIDEQKIGTNLIQIKEYLALQNFKIEIKISEGANQKFSKFDDPLGYNVIVNERDILFCDGTINEADIENNKHKLIFKVSQ
jgi:hypothetical protein